MSRIKNFIKQEITLCIAFSAAIISCLWVRPDSSYWGYIDSRTLALLYCLIVVVAGLRGAGVFSVLAHQLCSHSGSVRSMGMVLIALCFFSAMLVTNDVALLTFVPFSVVVMGLAGQTEELAWVVVLQTVAANLGSILTPVGNPQNLYLYSYFDMSMREFFSATAPIWFLSAVLVGLLCLRLPKEKISVFLGEKPTLDKKALVIYLILFAVCMLVVLRMMDWPIMLGIVVTVLLVYERKVLLKGDFLLLLTFICFFVFAGNLARIEAVDQLLRRLLSGHEMLLGAVTSQIISNVPSAILLSGFTDNAGGLLLGVDIGGLGTPVASLASLISLKLYSQAECADLQGFMKKFLAVNFVLLAFLLAVGKIFVG